MFTCGVASSSSLIIRSQLKGIVRAAVIEVIVAALHAHPRDAGVAEWGCAALGNLSSGDPPNQVRVFI
jgi:hypothetical protein